MIRQDRLYKKLSNTQSESMAGRYLVTVVADDGADHLFFLENNERGIPIGAATNDSGRTVTTYEIGWMGHITWSKDIDGSIYIVPIGPLDDRGQYIYKLPPGSDLLTETSEFVIDGDPGSIPVIILPPNLGQWLFFYDSDTLLPQVDGSVITGWNDGSANAVHIDTINGASVEAIAGAGPDFYASKFGSTSHDLASSSTPGTSTTSWRVFIVAKADTGANGGFGCAVGDSGTRVCFYTVGGNLWMYKNTATDSVSPAVDIRGDGWHVYEYVQNGDNTELYIDGNTVMTDQFEWGASLTLPDNSPKIGNLTSITSEVLGNVAWFGAYDESGGALTALQRAQFVQQLKDKYGIS